MVCLELYIPIGPHAIKVTSFFRASHLKVSDGHPLLTGDRDISIFVVLEREGVALAEPCPREGTPDL